MFDLQTFNPRDAAYKAPFGAAAVGTRVRFSVRPPRRAGFSGCTLTARFEFQGDAVATVPMPWVGFDGGQDEFSATLDTGHNADLVWYSFRLYGFQGREWRSEEYQLTVYDDADPAPPWFGAGVCYHIFPDRFRRSRIPNADGMVGNRSIHTDWDDLPEFRPNHNGEVTNRDFFGGDLAGMIEKLDYIKSLGTETIYLCPVFEAPENHRYGTSDYENIDPMLGTNEAFTRLCAEAAKRGMRIMLDGVFNHIGFVSKYFNGDGFYGNGGAAQDRNSPYYRWFNFTHWPDKYEAWWGFYSLPAVREGDASYRAYMLSGQDSIVRRWLRAGAAGWRLDVADELPDDFVAELHAAARAEKPDAVVIGEVWEDGSTKIAYGVRRRHVLGGHCDGLMNYPLRTALIDYLLHGRAAAFAEQMEALRENYPRDVFYSCMNALGTHDTPRILTLLGIGSPCTEHAKAWRAERRMTPEEYRRGEALLMVGATALYAFPGAPTLYYGDEAGMEGFEDPFNRATYPWGRENKTLLTHFTKLGSARATLPALRRGELRYLAAQGHLLAFSREMDGQTVIAALNSGGEPARLELAHACVTDLLSGAQMCAEEGRATQCVTLPPYSSMLLYTNLPSISR